MSRDNPLLRYKILKKIGAGGMASVFLAEDKLLKREVAVKMVHPHLTNNPKALRRFSNEARAVAALSHENIVRIFDFGETGSRPFLVMEYIDGITLEDMICSYGAIPNMVTVEIALQVLAGLLCAHEKGIYHRDIKPGNLLIDRFGRVRITDFGLAYLVNEQSMTLTGSILGSPHYISPEQISNTRVCETTDIFSLGVVLYRCLTGVFPFDAETPHGVIHRILTADPPPPAEKNRRVLLWLADLVELCLVKEASYRPSGKDLCSRLEHACRNESTAAGAARIVSFINNPVEYRASEEAELFAVYRAKALSLIDKRENAAALRAFEQASRFGDLSAQDCKCMERLSRQPAMLRRSLIGAGAVIGTAFLLFMGGLLKRSSRRPSPFALTPPVSNEAGSVDRKDSIALPQPNDTTLYVVDESNHPVNVSIDVADRSVKEFDAGKSLNIRPADSRKTADTSVQVTDTTYVSATGFLQCFTNPPWTTVYIDDIEVGKTPTISAIPLRSGKHVVRLVRENFATFEDTVTVAPAETTAIRIRLQPQRRDQVAR